ncbi:hypothetical protein V9K67_12670 [Paraflavisolibacter sp. H34]|uniref:hypothetical protein n=1 Tax=Huijunlia imazamoxiresistens TaxID=3127457 RepID=UPI0030199B5C
MGNLMQPVLLLIIFFFIVNFQEHHFQGRKVTLNDITWTFVIPEPLHFSDSLFDKNGNIKPEKWTQSGEPFSFDLFSINNGNKGSIGAFLRKDTLSAKQWEDDLRKDATWYFESVSQLPTKRLLDSAYSSEVFNQQTYKRQYIKYFDAKRKDTVFLFHYFTRCKAKQKNLNLTLDISFAFTDSCYGHKYFELVNSSNFSD